MAEYQSTVLSAFAEVENTLASEQYLKDQERYLSEATEEAISALELAESQYESGLINFVTTLTTRRAALQNQSRWLSARRARIDNRVNLYLALGAGVTVADADADADAAEEEEESKRSSRQFEPIKLSMAQER